MEDFIEQKLKEVDKEHGENLGYRSWLAIKNKIDEIERYYKDRSATLRAVEMFLEGKKYGVSSDIEDGITYGYGKLSDYGTWEFQIPNALVEMKREYERKIIELTVQFKRAEGD